jgi:tetrathionate reductase subunit B
MKAFVIDLNRCSGCYRCQISCKDEYVGNDWSPYSKPEPDTGQFWMKIVEQERGTIPKVKVTYMHIPCQHCDNAPCIKSATNGAIYKRSDGLVIIDPVKSVGQKQLVAACPYGAIYWNDSLNIPQKCTGCAHIVDGNAGIPAAYPLNVPRCVDSCHTSAISFGEEADLQSLISKAEVFHPEYGTTPRVYYLGLPKPFIAGQVFDSQADEVLIGAAVTGTDLASGDIFTAQTDSFGDFWLKELKWNHTYSVKIELQGYYPKTIGAVQTGKDVNLGDIALLHSR